MKGVDDDDKWAEDGGEEEKGWVVCTSNKHGVQQICHLSEYEFPTI